MIKSNNEVLVDGSKVVLPYKVEYSCDPNYGFAMPPDKTPTCNGESGNFEPVLACSIGKKYFRALHVEKLCSVYSSVKLIT